MGERKKPLSICTACSCGKHLYLKKPKLVQKAAEISDNLGTGNKLLSHKVIKNQIQISLTEPGFLKEQQKKDHADQHV